ncbi:FAD-dependent oxidoreductase [Glutamicibacter sp.]|uniref:FAD-dependent oxidoreductase n=1 Tax=Glutamicibacter sp. TaxID=1931995 RepID=UPI002FE1575E
MPELSSPLNLTVIGSGVIGLSTAHELASHGHKVRVISDQEPLQTVSAVAAAIWFPYHSENSPAADVLLARTLARFEALSLIPETGVDLRFGVDIERSADADRSWTRHVADAQVVEPSAVPAGALSATSGTVPVITMPTYLEWLQNQCRQLGVIFEQRTVSSIAELSSDTDAVVLSAGLRGGELLGDDQSVYPIRGQVIRLANTVGLRDWLSDDDHPDGVAYIIPRRDDIIVGGTDVANDTRLEVDEQLAQAMLTRAIGLVPELADCAVLEHKVGLRPARETIRLERVAGHEVPVIAAYGHGGGGVTLSWGTAERVVELLDQ